LAYGPRQRQPQALRGHAAVGADSCCASVAPLGISLKAIPVGVAYAIWSVAGTVLIALMGILWFQEAATPLRLVFIAMILIGATGLNLTTRSH
jgi:multidrug transporter EmrE-like cation transporter